MPSLLKTFFLSFLLLVSLSVFGQAGMDVAQNVYRIAFYNVENYFDAAIDSSGTYHEFEPAGERHWTYSRYADKRNKIYQVISALEGWQQLSMIAFAEIENRFVLEDLIASTPLKTKNYGIVHSDSDDERGIDVGLIYLKENIKPLFVQFVPVVFASDPGNKTREILYLKALVASDTLHVFINHWPSRYGGILATNSLREEASNTLVRLCDSVCIKQPDANILIMGDFNDERDNPSMIQLVSNTDCHLVNLEMVSLNKQVLGTLKYQGHWNTFDQVIVSESLLHENGNLMIKNAEAVIFSDSFLLEEDKTFTGLKPKRTYSGYKYKGGFSDHLPVYVDIYTSNSK